MLLPHRCFPDCAAIQLAWKILCVEELVICGKLFFGKVIGYRQVQFFPSIMATTYACVTTTVLWLVSIEYTCRVVTWTCSVYYN